MKMLISEYEEMFLNTQNRWIWVPKYLESASMNLLQLYWNLKQNIISSKFYGSGAISGLNHVPHVLTKFIITYALFKTLIVKSISL